MHERDCEDRRHPMHVMADALRVLATDIATADGAAPPRLAMRMADVAAVVWRHHLKHNPADPQWWNRDRFVLAGEQAPGMLDALEHLGGYDLTLDEIRGPRRRTSHVPGHPPVMHMPGVATGTVPQGTSLASAVSIALGERMAAARFNRDDLDVVDHRTYAMVDGRCLRDSESREACTVAADWQLAKLTVLSDDAGSPLDRTTSSWYRDDTVARFREYGWNVLGPVDADAPGAIDRAIRLSHASRDKPTLIIVRTRPAPEPVGPRATREALRWPHRPFEIPVGVRAMWDARASGAAAQAEWQALVDVWRARHPEDAAELSLRMRREGSADIAMPGRRTIEASPDHLVPTGRRRGHGPVRDDHRGAMRRHDAGLRSAGGPEVGIAASASIA
jgi:transketolase